jgi:dTDP-4-dehydrorhamnose reductase
MSTTPLHEKRILITGANGLLGQKLIKTFKGKFQIVASGFEDRFFLGDSDIHYEILDITDSARCKAVIHEVKPDIIVNAASYTNVDGCEVEREACWDVNVKGVENLAKSAKSLMTLLIHVSTDFIFDGKSGPYSERYRPNPLGYYGKSKLASENVCRISGVPFAIVRTSVLFGLGVEVKQNFFIWLYNNLKDGNKVNIVTDQFNTPTLVDDLAGGIFQLIQKSAYNVYNISGGDFLNRYEYATALADVFGFEKNLITPITTNSLRQKAKRPMRGGLKIDKARQEFGYHPRSLVDAFLYLKESISNGRLGTIT